MGEILQKKYGALRKCLAFILSIVMVLSTMTFTVAVADDEPTTSTDLLNVSGVTVSINGTAIDPDDEANNPTISVTEGDSVKIVVSWTFDETYSSDYSTSINLGLSGIVLSSEYSSTQYIYEGDTIVGEWSISSNGYINVKFYAAYLQSSGKTGYFSLDGVISVNDSDINTSDGTATITVYGKDYTIYYTKAASTVNVYKSAGTVSYSADGSTVYQTFTVNVYAWGNSVTLTSLEDELTGYTDYGDTFTLTSSDGSMSGTFTSLSDLNAYLSGKTLNASQNISITYTAAADATAAFTGSTTYGNKATVNYKDEYNEDKSKYDVTSGVNVSRPDVYKYSSGYTDNGDGTATLSWTIKITLGDLQYLNGFDVKNIKITDTLGPYLSYLSDSDITIDDFTETYAGSGVYTYTYTTTVSSEAVNATTSTTLTNNVSVNFGYGITDGYTGTYKIEKSILNKSDGEYDSTTGQVKWTITIQVPEDGLTSAYITDSESTYGSGMTTSSIYIGDVQIYDGSSFTSAASSILDTSNSYVYVYQTKLTFLDSYTTSSNVKNSTITITVYTEPDFTYITKETTVYNYVTLYSNEQTESDQGEWKYSSSTSTGGALEKTGAVSTTEDYTVDYELDINLYDLVSDANLTTGDTIKIEDVLPEGMSFLAGSWTASLAYIDIYGYQGSNWSEWYDPYYIIHNADGNTKVGAKILTSSDLSVECSFDSSTNTLTFTQTATSDLLNTANLYGVKPYNQDDYVEVHLIITYKAALTSEGIVALSEDDDHTITYTNNATITATGYSDTAAATVDLTQNDVVTKYTTAANTNYGSAYVSYEVIVNPDALTLGDGTSDLIATDTLGTALSLNISSIKVVETDTNTELVAGTDYSHSYDTSTNVLTFALPDGVALTISYTAYINAATGTKLDTVATNTFELSSVDAWNDSDSVLLTDTITSASAGAESATIYIYKYTNDGQMSPLSGAEFTVYNTNSSCHGSSVSYTADTNSVVNSATIETDADGTATVNFASTVYGKVLALVEADAPAGYVLDSEPYLFVVLSVTGSYSSEQISDWETAGVHIFYGGSTTTNPKTINVVNESQTTTASITVNKTKSDKTTNLEGANFELTSEDGYNLSTVKVENATTSSSGTNLVSFTTGTSSVVISNLLSGTYTLTETSAPEGYVCAGACKIVIMADTSNVTVTLDGTNDSVSISDTTITVVNDTETPTPVTETPTPVTETPTPVTETPTPVTETPTPVTETPTPVTETPTPVTEAPTPVTETPTPVTETPTPVTETPVPTATDTPTPTPLTTKISIKKTDGEGNAIEGVTFGIYSDKDCTTAIDILTTDSNGEATSTKDYEAGTYYLKEISAPDEYVKLSRDVYVITLDDQTTYVSISIDGDDQVSIENQVIVVVNLTVTPTNTSTETPTPVTETPTPVTETPTPVTDTPVPTATDTPVPSATDTPVPTATDTPVPTATDTPVPSATDTPVPTATDTPVPTATDTPVPTATDTPVPTATDTPTPTPLTTKISIKKTDGEGNAIEGVIFGIYSDKDCTTGIETLTTNASGEATSTEDYGVGTYYLKEISAPDEYVKLSRDVYVITLDDQTTYVSISIDGDDQVSIENQVIVVVNLTVTPTNTSTETPTPVTDTPVPTATDTPVPTATDTPVPTATDTPVPSATDTPVPTATDTPVPTATDTPVPTATDTPVPTATDTPVPTATDTPVPTATDTPVPTATDTPTATPTDVPTATPTDTPTDAPTATPTDAPTATATPTPEAVATAAATATPTPEATATPTPTPVSEEDSNLIVEVLDEDTGEPVEGAVVRITDAYGNSVDLVTGKEGKVFGDFEIGDYTIEVISVPDGYTVTTGQTTTVTLVENETAEHQAKIAKLDGAQLGDSDSGTLPITGMLVWPISLLSILGALFTVGGVIDNRRRRTK